MTIQACLDRLAGIYDSMDRAYRGMAALHGFECTGCEDNCCRTYFYHYTAAEYLYLLKGFAALEGPVREEIMDRARKMCKPGVRADYLCPLNVDGLCILYPYRSMICRLHGLPYTVKRPDSRKEEGPGCDRFEAERLRKGLAYRRIDRTPFYRELALLELEIRRSIPCPPRFKKTIAEMLRDGGGLRTGTWDFFLL